MIIDSLKIRNYKGAREVELNDMSSKCLFVGENGAGKSSILNAIGLIFGIPPSTGGLIFAGRQAYSEEVHKKYNVSIQCSFTDGKSFNLGEKYTYYKQGDHKNIKWFSVGYNNVRLEPSSVAIPELKRKYDDKIIQKLSELIDINIISDSSSDILRFGYGKKAFFEKDLSEGNKKYAYMLARLEVYREVYPHATINLIVDSPETHLHPSLLEKYIQRLQRIVFPDYGPPGQFICATHSPILLSILDDYEIYRISKYRGGNQYLGKNPSNRRLSYLDLVGDNLLKSITIDLLETQNDPQFSRFLKECLDDYTVQGEAPKGDSQRLQITSCLASKIGKKLRILDYGAGVGRNMFAIFESLGHHFKKLEYVAYEPEKENFAKLEKLAKETKQKRLYVTDNVENIKDRKFDIVLMSNVLHEIDVKDIVTCLGFIHSALKRKGLLIVQEHQLLAGEPGYLLFNDEELFQIFKTGGSPAESTKSGIDLSFYCVNKPNWNQVPNVDDVITALEMVTTRCKNDIMELRLQSKKRKLSRQEVLKNAFLYGLHVNASLAIDALKC
ncbi:MAG: AAA family ATPase [Desulforhopalus sp.]|nr:AAA family ATPase [Desulforhopalus sp.]